MFNYTSASWTVETRLARLGEYLIPKIYDELSAEEDQNKVIEIDTNNAKLISKAPEMFEIIKEFVDLRDNLNPKDDSWDIRIKDLNDKMNQIMDFLQ